MVIPASAKHRPSQLQLGMSFKKRTLNTLILLGIQVIIGVAVCYAIFYQQSASSISNILKFSAVASEPSVVNGTIPSVVRESSTVSVHGSSKDTTTANFSRSLFSVEEDIPRIKVKEVNCARLIDGYSNEKRKAGAYQEGHKKVVIPDEEIYKQASNCSTFLSDRKYILKPSSDDEADFPLAFSILMYKDVEQFERLLRVIYRPQNFYCVHVDKKSAEDVQDAVRAIVNCFENVFLAPEQFDVQWAQFSILEPELSCMKGLLKYKKWRYFINLTGQEFPLKTNWEIVEILKAFNGANNVAGTVKRRNMNRIAKFLPAPFNITVTKGSVHIAVTRSYVDYVINNATSLQFLDWVENTYYPDETYFSSLNHNPQLGIPGSNLGIPETNNAGNMLISRFKIWGDNGNGWVCHGKYVRTICIFGVGDLPFLTSRVELFANKFDLTYQPLVLDCLEEWYFNRTLGELTSGPKVNRTFYENLDYAKNHVSS